LAGAREQCDAAEGYYREALELAEKIGGREYEAGLRGNLGALALDRGEPAAARPWLERALPLAREVGREDIIASNLHRLARVLEAEGDLPAALDHARQALAIFERLRDRDVEESRELVAWLEEKVSNHE